MNTENTNEIIKMAVDLANTVIEEIEDYKQYYAVEHDFKCVKSARKILKFYKKNIND